MKIWKIALFALTAFVASCSIQKNTQPSVEITHVLAITAVGDTIALPMKAIRPVNYRVNYNLPIGYDYYGPWYRPNNFLIYSSNSNSSRGSNNTGSSKSTYGKTPNPKSVPSTDRSSNSATIQGPRR